MATKTRVTVKVPATTANLGPGFDCMGMALDIWNSIDVEPGPEVVEVVGEGADRLPGNRRNLVHRSFRLPFTESGQQVPQVWRGGGGPEGGAVEPRERRRAAPRNGCG